MRTIIIVQEVEAHGWLLSGIEELTELCCSFLTLVAEEDIWIVLTSCPSIIHFVLPSGNIGRTQLPLVTA